MKKLRTLLMDRTFIAPKTNKLILKPVAFHQMKRSTTQGSPLFDEIIFISQNNFA